MERDSSEDTITSCDCQKDITDTKSECVPEASPPVHHTTTLTAGESQNMGQCDSWDTYIPMHAATRLFNEFEMTHRTDPQLQESGISENQFLGQPECVSSDLDNSYVEIDAYNAQNLIDSESGYSIAELLDHETLPQVLYVTQGHRGNNEPEGLTEGDVVLSYCVIARDVVLAESTTGIRFTIPLKSQHKFFPVQDNIKSFADVQKLSLHFAHCKTVADLAKLPQLPRVVRATSASKGLTPDASVEKGMILFLEAVAMSEGRVTLVAKDLNGDERHLREKCKGGFELKPGDTWLLIEEVLQHSSLPTKVFLVNHQMLADSNAAGGSMLIDDDCTLSCQPFTLLCAAKQTYLAISKHNKSIEEPFNSDLVLEVPTTLSIRVKCIPIVEEKQEESLLQLAKTVYESTLLCPGQLVSETSLIMTEADHKLQELLYLTTFGNNTVEQIRLMVGGKPKVRLPVHYPLAVPKAQKAKNRFRVRSQDDGLTGQDVKGTISQLKSDIKKLEALVMECKDRLHRLEMNLQAGNDSN